MITILHIDDSDSDLLLTRRAFRGVPDVRIIEAKDGQTGIEMAIDIKPDIILLDLNLPKMRGDRVLSALKSIERTKGVPVIILTSSDDHEDIARVYNLNANAYISKPVTPEKFRKVANAVDIIWIGPAKTLQNRP